MLTPRQVAVLWAIAEFTRERGYPPLLPEIGERAGIHPPSVHFQLRRLAALGRVERTPRRIRGVRLALTPGVRVVPVVRCDACGGDRPADHTCPTSGP